MLWQREAILDKEEFFEISFRAKLYFVANVTVF
jgi:hypothetical protein